MTSDRIRIGVAGVGHLGKWHVQQLKKIEQANLVGIFDTDNERSHQIANEFNASVFSDFSSLLSNCDAISIVTPTTTHFSYANEALEKGKHVFIEKPVTETVEQGEVLVTIADRNNLKLQIGHIERFNSAIIALEDIKIDPLFIESHRLANFNPRGTDVAVVLDLMIHDIDLILSFVNSPVKDIQASGVSIISLTEDIANCRINFENGCVANVTASRISTSNMRKMRFFQPNAYISVDFLSGASDVYKLVSTKSEKKSDHMGFSLGSVGNSGEEKEIRYTRYEKKNINPLNYELTLFLKAIIEDNPVAVSGSHGVRALRVAKEILNRIDKHAQLVKKYRDL